MHTLSSWIKPCLKPVLQTFQKHESHCSLWLFKHCESEPCHLSLTVLEGGPPPPVWPSLPNLHLATPVPLPSSAVLEDEGVPFYFCHLVLAKRQHPVGVRIMS